MSPDCVFCKIRDGAIPSAKLYEDERTLAIMDIGPLTPGHCLVITKAHAANLYEAEPADLAAAIMAAKRVGAALRTALKPDGLNLMQANGPGAFQSVQHFHIHLIPRYTNDGRGMDWTPTPGSRDEIVANADKIKSALGGMA
jgi:histidine triad (HIT) family protein